MSPSPIKPNIPMMNKINKLNTLSKIEYGDDIHPIINPMQISQFGIF